MTSNFILIYGMLNPKKFTLKINNDFEMLEYFENELERLNKTNNIVEINKCRKILVKNYKEFIIIQKTLLEILNLT